MKTTKLAQQRYEKTLAQCASRARLWREYVANYQRVMIETPELFEKYSADFRERYLLAATHEN